MKKESVRAIILISTVASKESEVFTSLEQSVKEESPVTIESLDHLSGEYDLLLRLSSPTRKDFNAYIMKNIAATNQGIIDYKIMSIYGQSYFRKN